MDIVVVVEVLEQKHAAALLNCILGGDERSAIEVIFNRYSWVVESAHMVRITANCLLQETGSPQEFQHKKSLKK